MDQTTIEKDLREQREMIEKIYVSVEKTRKYYLWTFWVTVILFVVPLIIMAFVLPSFIDTYTSTLNGSALGI